MSVENAVYNDLLSNIVNGRIRPGERMTLAGLAEQYNARPAVIRKSVRKLQKQGLVESRRKWGTYVKEHSVDEWLDYFRLREALETVAARRAAEVVTAEQSDILFELADKFYEAAKAQMSARSRKEQVRLEQQVLLTDRHFHRTIVRFSGSVLVARVHAEHDIHPISSIVDGRPIADAQFDRDGLSALLEKSHQEHRALCEAIKGRNADEAEQIMRQHIRFALGLLQQWKLRQIKQEDTSLEQHKQT